MTNNGVYFRQTWKPGFVCVVHCVNVWGVVDLSLCFRYLNRDSSR